ncbi:MAG: ribosome maturation factor RimM [Bacteroidales bacterium]|nr:ribosome maturation factor RimM [Bacteroidales bacterium]
MKNYFSLGTITKNFGFKGEVFAYLDTDEPAKYANLESVFIELDGELIPYMIENLRFKDTNTVIIKFRDVDLEHSKELIKAELYLPLSMLPPLTGNHFYYHEVIGFKVIDKEKGDIGTCKDFIDTGKQPIMQVDANGQEILIPVVDDFFETVDRENKILNIAAPEGLIDIYLSDNQDDDNDKDLD